MNFEPPDFTKDPSFSGSGLHQNPKGITKFSRTQFQEKQDSSPLLRTDQHKNKNAPISNNQMRNNCNQGNQHFRNPIHNRLGNWSYSHRNNNALDNVQSGNQGQRFNSRKRTGDSNAGGPMVPKRKWYQNSNLNQQNHTSVQNRLNRIRNSNSHEDGVQTNTNSYETVTNNTPYLNDSQDVDPTDITVEVVNNIVGTVPPEEQSLSRFKMVLDPKCQTAIRLLQQKCKDKQVIFPFPVTPNVTDVTLHQRFSLL